MSHFKILLLLIPLFFLYRHELLAQSTTPILSFSDFPDNLYLNCDDDLPTSFAHPSVLLDTVGSMCNGTLILDYLDNNLNGDCENSFTIERVWSAEICGDVIESSQYLYFNDTTPPIILSPIDGAHVCESSFTSIYPSAQDNCQSTISLSFNSVQSQYCDGVTLINYTITAFDNCGNTTIESRSVYVHDTMPPSFINVPVNDTVSCLASVSLQSATYDCPEGLVYIEENNSLFSSCTGSSVQNYSLTDACGATSYATRIITIIDDVPPVFETIIPDITLYCEDDIPSDLPNHYDVCATSMLTESVNEIQGNCPGERVVTRTFTITDPCGNSTETSQIVTFVDSLPPVFTSSPPAFTEIYWINGDVIPIPEYEIIDDCDVNSFVEVSEIITVDDSQGSDLAETIVRTLTATDGCLNTSSVTYTMIYHPQVFGCTDSIACNYNSIANDDDGSCLFDIIGYDCFGNIVPEEYCGAGTFWNSELGVCEAVSLSPGCYFDTNYNGTVDSNDLLTLLSAYGLTCE
ncbi:MAG: hypothetical protein COA49_05020 [Bacteroidetes bacterium]|nr:MAG: hypothetical protein COA49_05020 [Bacteroidota bacterium]